MKSLFTLVALSAVVGLLALAPASIAQVGTPTVDVYGGSPGGTQTQVGGVNANTPPSGQAPATAAPGQGGVAGVSATGSRRSGVAAGGAGAQAAGSRVEAAGNRLAFTGLEVGLVLAAGVLLLLVGTTVRWVTRRAESTTA